MDWLELGYWGLFLAGFVAGTIVPLSSEAVLIAMLLAGGDPMISIVSATIGNWIGGMTTWYIGHLGNWHWIEKYFRVDRAKVKAYQTRISKHGAILALLGWLPVLGNVIVLALGFFRVNWVVVSFWLLIGKIARYMAIYFSIEGLA